jgi:hypothetical protein
MAEVEVNEVRSAAVAVAMITEARNIGAAPDSDSEDDNNVGGIELLPYVPDGPVDNNANRKKFRGKNKRMTILATYENMENAMMDFTKEQLTQNEQVLVYK